MRKIASDVYIIERIGSANVFLLGGRDRFDLIDTGIFMMTGTLISRLKKNGFELKNLKNIILTHCHCDHIGGVTELVKYSDAKVAAHAADIPYIIQKEVIQGPYHGMMLEEQKAMKRLGCNIGRVDVELKDGDKLDMLNGLKVINVPGHTPGSVALYEEKHKLMFFGDVIRNSEKRGLTAGIPEKFNCDTDQTIKDAIKLLSFPIDYALLSHGKSIIKETGSILAELLSQTKACQHHC